MHFCLFDRCATELLETTRLGEASCRRILCNARFHLERDGLCYSFRRSCRRNPTPSPRPAMRVRELCRRVCNLPFSLRLRRNRAPLTTLSLRSYRSHLVDAAGNPEGWPDLGGSLRRSPHRHCGRRLQPLGGQRRYRRHARARLCFPHLVKTATSFWRVRATRAPLSPSRTKRCSPGSSMASLRFTTRIRAPS